ncbi:hypothetical protein TCAL_12561 [Tigriopus californicus]|uniref:Uncharacterized protein n=1 Tax=Tigriopus californicus TaxID=6832 RepID=A0A553PFM7_TIGCA|nr:3-oxoacyl-[acyl-carrier-protein] reductase FabG-like [Tigriopus californicus]TRY76476.1 hypothetical protein TCAL_12561 [Tigriopus californicus]|eukprot:TCALIF_12561-PA protein Name:"Similar to fabG 3-oxoacyl-[acyl-carrier-protein] reductase FabG (Thermotoga maritima (strain ATCC 43589 / MSB8 / DSM 3109 / JCM 10099))" AED:0.11 eAED:0.11 QI:0/1/1/1/1/1/4/70/282
MVNMSRVALITGASSGIGAAIALEMARVGHYALALTSNESKNLATVGQQCLTEGAKEVHLMVKDLMDLNQCQDLVSETVEHFKKMDVFVSCAGMSQGAQDIEDKCLKGVENVMRLNYLSPLAVTQKALPHLLKTRGSILYIGSTLGTISSSGVIDYAASKSALHSMAQNVAQEYSATGIRVNVLAPGAIATELFNDIMGAASPEQLDEFGSLIIPMGRLGRAQEIGHLAEFLVSDKNMYMTGSVIKVDGGQANDKKAGQFRAGEFMRAVEMEAANKKGLIVN